MQVTDVQGPAVLVLAADEVKTIREAAEIWRGWSGTKMMCDSITRTLIQAADAWERRNLDHIAVTKQCETLAAELRRLAAVNAQLLEALKSANLFLHHCWCDVQMNEYSYEKLQQEMAAVDAAIQKEQP